MTKLPWPTIQQALAAIRAGAPPATSFLAFGVDLADLEVEEVRVLVQKAQNEALIRIAITICKDDPEAWWKTIQPTVEKQLRLLEVQGAEDILCNQGLTIMFRKIAEFLRQHLSRESHDQFLALLTDEGKKNGLPNLRI